MQRRRLNTIKKSDYRKIFSSETSIPLRHGGDVVELGLKRDHPLLQARHDVVKILEQQLVARQTLLKLHCFWKPEHVTATSRDGGGRDTVRDPTPPLVIDVGVLPNYG